MALQWQRFNRGDCPVCNGARKDCRQNLSNNLIHCRDTESNPKDYIHRGEDSHGFGLWAYKADADDWNDEKRQQRAEENRLRKEAEREAFKRSLSDKERDREIRKTWSQLRLSESDRAILESRKYLSEEFINNCRSVTKMQPLSEAVNPALPGTWVNGRGLSTPVDGILIPTPNHLGLWVGMRLYDPLAKEDKSRTKYQPLTSAKRGVTIHNQKGEQYLAVYYPKDRENMPAKIGFCEGLEFKPAITAERLGYPVIGASGGNFASSPEGLKEAIACIEASRGKCQYILFPDGGSRVNKSVYSQYNSLHKLIGLDSVANCGQWEDKARGDIDEIEDLGAIVYADASEFFVRKDESQNQQLQEEIDPESYQEYIEFEAEEAAAAESHQKYLEDLKRENLNKQLSNILNRFYSKKKKAQAKTSPKPVDDGTKKRVYDRGDRLTVWRNGERFMLDTSPTGDGKSFNVSNLTPEDLGVKKIVYVTADPRNTTNPGFKDWALLSGRHDGLTINPLGEVRRRKKDQSYSLTTTEANCSRAKTSAAIASKNIPRGNTSNVICDGCPSFKPCIIPSSSPKKRSSISYLGDRIEALKADRTICHPSSLPEPGDGKTGFDYSEVALIWDESEIVFNPQKTIDVNLGDVKDTIARLMRGNTELLNRYGRILTKFLELMIRDARLFDLYHSLFTSILWVMIWYAGLFDRYRPLLEKLLEMMGAKQSGLYGYDGAYLTGELSALVPAETDIDILKEILQPDLSFLNPLDEYGENIADLPHEEKARFAESDRNLSDHATKNLLKQWLPEVIEALGGGGYLSLNYGVLTVSVVDDRLRRIAAATAKNLFLSATERTEHLAKRLGVEPTDIDTVTTGDGLPDNIDFRQVTDMGRLGIARGKQQSLRVEAILDHYKEIDKDNTAIISFKSHSKDDPDRLHHYTHSQGNNHAAGIKRLIIDGLPCPNLTSLKHDYFILTGLSPTVWNPDKKESENTEDFKLYIRHRVATILKQEIGRLRANRYPDRRFEVIFLTDYEFLSDIISGPIVNIEAHQITPDAESVINRTKRLIKEAVEKLAKEGKRISERAIAAITGLARNTINRLRAFLDEVIGLATNTIDNLYSKCGQSPEVDDETLEAIDEALSAATDDKEFWEFLSDCLAVLTDDLSYDRRAWRQLWRSLSPDNQKRILPRLIEMAT
ncbi:MAG: hypothetical protein N5P05_004582 [Chroococcopsis gigantea SAG 12.99]|nr:hypothetical protein [Chroococcopsis gigantea SAG 12.99]